MLTLGSGISAAQSTAPLAIFSLFPHCQHTSPDYLSLTLPGLSHVLKPHYLEPCSGAWKEDGGSRGAELYPPLMVAAQKSHPQNHSAMFLHFNLKPHSYFFPSPVSEKLQLLNSGFYIHVRFSNECFRSGFIDMRPYKPVSWNQATAVAAHRANCAPVWSVLLHIALLLKIYWSGHRREGSEGCCWYTA